jgi:hypothetical protein
LVEAGRNTLRPSQADRERMLEALRARIAQGAAPGMGGPTPVRGWPLVSGLGGAALLGGLLLWQLGPAAPAAPALLAPALPIRGIVAHAKLASVAPAAPLPSESTAPAAVAPEVTRSLGPRAPGGGLSEEVALLSRAETELHASRFGKALRLLDEYERRFPKGALMQESVAARVQALCAVGRVADAMAQLKRLSPGSPHAGRARAACGSGRL